MLFARRSGTACRPERPMCGSCGLRRLNASMYCFQIETLLEPCIRRRGDQKGADRRRLHPERMPGAQAGVPSAAQSCRRCNYHFAGYLNSGSILSPFLVPAGSVTFSSPNVSELFETTIK